jgi:WD40 repeat protein
MNHPLTLIMFRYLAISSFLIIFVACQEKNAQKKQISDPEFIEMESMWLRLGDHRGIQSLENPLASLLAAEISPDMKYIISSSRGGNDIVLWHTISGESAWEIILDKPTRVVKFTSDSKHILAGGDYNSVKIFEIPQGNLVKEIFLDGAVETIEFSSDEKLLATGDRSGKVTLWDTETWQVIGTALHDTRSLEETQNRNDVNMIVFTKDDQHIISGGINSFINKWSVPDLNLIDSVKSGTGSVKSLRLTHDGKFFATATGHPDGCVRMWDTESLALIDSVYLEFVVETIEFSRVGNFLLAGLSDNYYNVDSITEFIKVFRVIEKDNTPSLVLNQEFNTLKTKYLYFSPDGGKLVSAHTNGILQLWDITYK